VYILLTFLDVVNESVLRSCSMLSCRLSSFLFLAGLSCYIRPRTKLWMGLISIRRRPLGDIRVFWTLANSPGNSSHTVTLMMLKSIDAPRRNAEDVDFFWSMCITHRGQSIFLPFRAVKSFGSKYYIVRYSIVSGCLSPRCGNSLGMSHRRFVILPWAFCVWVGSSSIWSNHWFPFL
jgi:hypothetical protein